MGLPNINWINNPLAYQTQMGGLGSSWNNTLNNNWDALGYSFNNTANNQWNSYNNIWGNPSFNNFYQPGFAGLSSSNSGAKSGETYQEYLERTKIAPAFLTPKVKKQNIKFTAAEEDVLINEYKRLHITPPSESLTSAMGTQAAFGTVMQAKSVANSINRSETKAVLNEAAKEPMSKAWEEATWKDFLKPSEAFKTNQEFNQSVDELTKSIIKLEKRKGALRKSKRIDSELYEKILKEAKNAVKSGDKEAVNLVTKWAKIAKDTKNLEAFMASDAPKCALNEFRIMKEGGISATNLLAPAETATGKTGVKALGKIALKKCSKFVPYIGDALFAGIEIYNDWDKLKAAKEKGGGALAKQCVHTGVKTAAVVGGFAVGMKVGAAIGSCIPIPIVGTVVGAIVGGILGGAISWLGSKVAKWTTELILGEEPGINAQTAKLRENNNYVDKNGDIIAQNFENSGHGTLVKALLEDYYTNGIGEKGISADSARILKKYGYIDDSTNLNFNA